MYDVITIGSATVDVFAKSESELLKFFDGGIEKDYIAYPSGSKILISELDFLVGGGGTNTAVSFSRLGLHTAYLGKIGSSENSVRVLKNLSSEKVDFIGGREGRTGFSIVLDSIEQDRSILTFKGSNNNLLISDVDLNRFEAKWLYSSSMVEKSFETLKELVSIAKKKGMKIAFNPSNYQAKLGMEKLGSFLKQIDVIIMNLEEARLLLGVNEGNAEELLSEISFFNEQTIIITDGSKGATCLSDKNFYQISPSPNLEVIESTGAGDAFASGFIAGLIRKYSVEDALKLGMVQAQGVIAHKGAKIGLLHKEESFAELAKFTGEINKLNSRNIKPLNIPRKELDELVVEKYGETNHLKISDFYITTEDKYFILNEGTSLTGLEDLDSALKYMSGEVFSHHVHDGENHFAKWVVDVFNENELAQELRMCTTKIAMRVAINNFLQSKKRID